MRGGLEEGPCWSDDRLERYESVTGKPCPYVELRPENTLFDAVLPYVMDERLRGFLMPEFKLLTGGLDPWEQQALRRRLAVALNRRDVHDALYPELKKLREERERRPAAGRKR